MYDGVLDYAEPWNITVQDPQHPFNSTVGFLRFQTYATTSQTLNHAMQAGACFVGLMVVLVLAKPEKRFTLVYLSNVIALASCFIGVFCNSLYYILVYRDPIVTIAPQYAHGHIPTSALANNVISQLSLAIAVIAIEVSLLKQAMTVTKSTVEGISRSIIYVFIACVTAAAVLSRLIFTVETLIIQFRAQFSPHHHLQMATEIIFASSVASVSLILVWKLAVTVYSRRKLGVTKFGPTQIIFIMFCQTMIIPTIICFLEATISLPARHVSMTITVLCLPLSNLWASIAKSQMNPNQGESKQRFWALPTDGTVTCKCHQSTTSTYKPRYMVSVPKNAHDTYEDDDDIEAGMETSSPTSQTLYQSDTRNEFSMANPNDVSDHNIDHKLYRNGH